MNFVLMKFNYGIYCKKLLSNIYYQYIDSIDALVLTGDHCFVTRFSSGSVLWGFCAINIVSHNPHNTLSRINNELFIMY